MDLDRLQHLVSLAETRSFSGAAERCGLSQSSFSRSIQAAEEEVGRKLFDRSTRVVRCTEVGGFVVERARALLQQNQALERDVGLYRELQLGSLAIGAGPYPAATLMADFMVALRTRFPGVELRLEVNSPNSLAAHLREGLLDFYVADVAHAAGAEDLVLKPIRSSPIGFFVRAGHPLLAGGGPVALTALPPYGVACVRASDAYRRHVGKLMGLPEGALLPLVVQCNSTQVLAQLALDTDTVVAISLAGLDAEFCSGRLVQIDGPEAPLLRVQWAVVSLAGRSHSPLAQFSISLLEQLAARAGGEG